tara:strand:- start:1349 stop:1726 length:378 start_codon:yes stop_codon:yes gene_type:complete
MVTKINPIFDVAQARSFLTKTITVIELDLNANAAASTGPTGAINAVLQAVAERVTIVAHSALTGTGELMTLWVEGEFPTDTYDGTNSETFVVYLTSVLVALGTVDTVDLSGAAATAGVVYKADQV